MNLAFDSRGRRLLAMALAGSVLCGALTGSARAAVSFADIQFGGFASQGWIQNWGNNYPFEAKDGTFDFREVAFNASYSTGSIRLGAQVFAQRLGNYGEDQPLLDWAVLDYSFRREIGLRAGRVKFPKGLYGEALDVDAIRPFVFLPTAFYNPVMRDFNSSFDGAMLYGNLDAGAAGSVDYKVFYGDIAMDTDKGVADFFNTTDIYAAPGITRLGLDHVYGGQLMWNTPVIGLRTGYSFNALAGLSASGPLAQAPIYEATLQTDAYYTHTVSAEYFYNQWTFAAEWQHTTGDFDIINPFGTNQTTATWVNWYVSAARRLTDRIEVGAYYSAQEDTGAGANAPALGTYNREWVGSVRYDFSDRWLVKLEGHWGKGLLNIFDTVRTPNPAPDARTTTLAVKTTYVF